MDSAEKLDRDPLREKGQMSAVRSLLTMLEQLGDEFDNRYEISEIDDFDLFAPPVPSRTDETISCYCLALTESQLNAILTTVCKAEEGVSDPEELQLLHGIKWEIKSCLFGQAPTYPIPRTSTAKPSGDEDEYITIGT